MAEINLMQLLGAITGKSPSDLVLDSSGNYKPRNRFFDIMSGGEGMQMAQRANIQSQMQKAQQEREFASRAALQQAAQDRAYDQWLQERAYQEKRLPEELKARGAAQLDLENRLAAQKAAAAAADRTREIENLGRAADIIQQGEDVQGMGPLRPEVVKGTQLFYGPEAARGYKGVTEALQGSSQADFLRSVPGSQMMTDQQMLAALMASQERGARESLGQGYENAKLSALPQHLAIAKSAEARAEDEFRTPIPRLSSGFAITPDYASRTTTMQALSPGGPGYEGNQYMMNRDPSLGGKSGKEFIFAPRELINEAKSKVPVTEQKTGKTETSPRAPLLSATAPAGISSAPVPTRQSVQMSVPTGFGQAPSYQTMQVEPLGGLPSIQPVDAFRLGAAVPTTVRQMLPFRGYQDELNPDAALMYQANPPKLQNFMGLSPEDFQRVRRIYSRE